MDDVVRESVAAYGAPIRRMTVREFHRAGTKRVFGHDERLELLRGEVVRMSPQNSLHAWVTSVLRERLPELFPGAYLREHSPLSLDDRSETEPDLLVAVGPTTKYIDRHPGPADTLLVIEVSDSSQRVDRRLKASLYAEFSIPEYWVVDLKGSRVEVHRQPREDAIGKHAYASVEIVGVDGNVQPIKSNGRSIAVRDFLPSGR